MNVDAIDLKILKYLQDNARLSNQNLLILLIFQHLLVTDALKF